jgi:uncharacterized membrane protein YeaQ/YmgE (transglycosylase-associated protein family)
MAVSALVMSPSAPSRRGLGRVLDSCCGVESRNRTTNGVFAMGWFSFLILGIIAGVIAKLILRTKANWFLTIILGVLGAMIGGWIAGLIPGIGYENFWSIQSWLIAIVGALIVLFIYGLITRRRTTKA